MCIFLSLRGCVEHTPSQVPGDEISFEQEVEKQAKLAAWTGAANQPAYHFLVQGLFCHLVQSGMQKITVIRFRMRELLPKN